MNVVSFVEGPLLWTAFVVFFLGIVVRFAAFSMALIRNSRNRESQWRHLVVSWVRFFLPFHNGIRKKPLYSIFRYVFHACLFAVPIFLFGHVVLWEESRFGWIWNSLPDEWADYMTWIVLASAAYFLVRRIVLRDVRRASSLASYVLVLIVALPYVSGYFLSHGTLDSVEYFRNHLWKLSREAAGI